ncbi:MAG: AmmeMemoRadiSam system radical SAM enzyme [bacterium]
MQLASYASRPALHWRSIAQGQVECGLCPRHCHLQDGQMGFCGVRGAVDGKLHTFNYGLALAATEEFIETEAVVHFSPGARILSLGNIGCMMSCVFCQNWQTSQIKHLDAEQIRRYTPQALVQTCLENGIHMLSWTYNDPVVWHEFVVETSRLAQQHGLKNIYKSAFYIEEDPVDELIDCIDIFSLSLKSMREAFYRDATQAELAPVLSRIVQVARSKRHLEISYLLVPGLNDATDDIRRMIEWVLANVGPRVPLHFVAFHPAYLYTQVARTPLRALIEARAMALAMGMHYVYLGNTQQEDLNDSRCAGCGAMLVSRYGLKAAPSGLGTDGRCKQCGVLSPIVCSLEGVPAPHPPGDGADFRQSLVFHWNTEAQSVHVVRTAGSAALERLRLRPLGGGHPVMERTLAGGLDRFIVTRQSPRDTGVVVSWESDSQYQIFPLLDRAHYPVATPVADEEQLHA